MVDRQGKVRKLIGTAQDITERKRIEQLKSDFVSMVSHQLKTPVALIRGYVDNLLAGFVGELTEQQRQYLDQFTDVVAAIGYSKEGFYNSYFHQPSYAITFEVQEVFEQTPYKGTGFRLAQKEVSHG